MCRHRGDENRLGHDDVCMRRNRWTVRRHDAVKTLIANALAKIDSIDARVEPRTLEGRRRNDISIRGRGISGTRALDYDIKDLLLAPRRLTQDHHASSRRLHSDRTFVRSGHTLPQPSGKKSDSTPEAIAKFRAIVMSTGGLVAREPADEVGKWKRELGEWTFEKMMGRISLELLKSRARQFEV